MSLSKSCRLLGVSRQSVYQYEKRWYLRFKDLEKVKELVLSIRMKMPRIGTRKLYYLIKDKLKDLGIKIGRDGLFDYLRYENLLVKKKKNYTKTTHSKHWLWKHPNLVKDLEVYRKEQVFVSDITYVETHAGTHYLSLVTDAFTRKIMGYHLSKNMNASHVVKALKMAIKNRTCSLDLIHHSDRGLQYCSKIYQDVLDKHMIKPSMTDGYDCYQNALAERMNGILKQEFLIEKCKDFFDLKKMVEEAITIYNHERPHLSLNYLTPNYMHKNSCELMPTAT